VLALAAGVGPILVGAVYVLLSAGNQTALGAGGFAIARVLPLLGLLLLLGGLIWPSRRSLAPRSTEVEAPA
jgi:predicted lipid-binding transport protein (Tim44 family)